MKKAMLLVVLGAFSGVPSLAVTYKSMLHMGSSIMSTSRGYGTSFYATLSPLQLQTIHYANLETISAISQSLSKTKSSAASLSSDGSNLSRFGGASEKIPSNSTPLYAGYDIVNFTLDYHSVKGWRESTIKDAQKKSSFQSSLGSIFDRFHKAFPNAICTFTNSTPVAEPYWGDIKDNYDFAYNSVVRAVSAWAAETARAKKVPIVDLNAYCERNGIKPGSDGRHFSAADRDKQGRYVGQQMLKALNATPATSLNSGAHDVVLTPKSRTLVGGFTEHTKSGTVRFLVNGALINQSTRTYRGQNIVKIEAGRPEYR